MFLESLQQDRLNEDPMIMGMPGEDQGRMLSALGNTRDTIAEMGQAGYDPEEDVLRRLATIYTKRGLSGQRPMDTKTLNSLLEGLRARGPQAQAQPPAQPQPQEQGPRPGMNDRQKFWYSIPGVGPAQRKFWEMTAPWDEGDQGRR